MSEKRRRFIFKIPLMAFASVFLKKKIEKRILRPPGSLPEPRFYASCLRCMACVDACPTGIIKPSPFLTGGGPFLTPYLDFSQGGCDYNCNRCGQVCPSGAIKPLSLEEKRNYKIGIARIDRSKCLAYAKGISCLVCEEYCPIPQKAIKIVKRGGKLYPMVDEALCNGCGWCEYACPVEGKAIKVYPL